MVLLGKPLVIDLDCGCYEQLSQLSAAVTSPSDTEVGTVTWKRELK